MARYLNQARAAWLLFAVFVTMTTLGLLWGGFGTVLTNGVAICLDCIGLF